MSKAAVLIAAGLLVCSALLVVTYREMVRNPDSCIVTSRRLECK